MADARALMYLVVVRDFHQWASFLCDAQSETGLLGDSFTSNKHSIAILLAPRGNTITSDGDPFSISQDLLPTIHTEVPPVRPSNGRPQRCSLWRRGPQEIGRMENVSLLA